MKNKMLWNQKQHDYDDGTMENGISFTTKTKHYSFASKITGELKRKKVVRKSGIFFQDIRMCMAFGAKIFRSCT